MKFLLAASFATVCLSCYGQPPDLVSNLQYRLRLGDLGQATPAPFKNARTLRIEQGGEQLLQTCLERPLEWTQDRLLFRFGHLHAARSTSCRERTSPSMHIVGYDLADGSRETRIHFDLHGPHNPLGHFGEVVRNRLTFGRTSEAAVYRGLVKRDRNPDTAVPPPAYSYSEHANDFYKAAFGASAFAGAAFAATASSLINRGSNWGAGAERYTNHLEANLARNAMQQAIMFGVGAALQQDQTFATSHDERIGRRMRAALVHSMFVQGRGGEELAFPRIAAALGASWITHQWHPWRVQAPNPWVDTAMLMSKYVIASYWHEFRPEIRQQLSKARGLLRH